MMSYVGLLYQDLIKAKQVLPHHKLPPVLSKSVQLMWNF